MGKFIKWFFIYVLVICVIGGLGLAAKVILFPVHTANTLADAVQNTTDGVINKTINADNAIFNYEDFKDRYNGIIATKNKYIQAAKSVESFKKELPADRTKWSFNDSQTLSNKETVKDGILAQLNDLIGQYNSNASKLNRKLFKDRNLPDQIPTTDQDPDLQQYINQ